MGRAQTALPPPPAPLCQRGKKVPQTILASPYTPDPPLGPNGNNTFQKGASFTQSLTDGCLWPNTKTKLTELTAGRFYCVL